jgi:hypothetical protein
MNIFLSYASEDKDVAEQVYLNLVEGRHRVFFDRPDLPAGGVFNTRIRDAIKKSELFVFLISPDSVDGSSYAITELNFAREKWAHPGGHVLPVIVRETGFELIPNYLKAVTVLEPEGNVAAEVARRVANWPRRVRKPLIWAILGFVILAAILTSVIMGVYATHGSDANQNGASGNADSNTVPDPKNANVTPPSPSKTSTASTNLPSQGPGYNPCINQSFPGTPAGRMAIMEEGAKEADLFGSLGQSIGEGFVIQFNEGGKFIGAIRFFYYPAKTDLAFFKVSEVRGARCQKIDDYSNWNTKEVQGSLDNWHTVQMPLGEHTYYLRLGYTRNEGVDRIEALFKNKPQQ